MHSSIAVANKILEIASETDDPSITPLQLIKLTYLSHGWMLGLYGRSLIAEEAQAWPLGPVFDELYQAVRHHRSKPVTYPVKAKGLFSNEPDQKEFDEYESDVMEQVYDVYGGFDGIVLSELTHQTDSPWYRVWHSHGKKAVISDDLIEHHYKVLADRVEDHAACVS